LPNLTITQGETLFVSKLKISFILFVVLLMVSACGGAAPAATEAPVTTEEPAISIPPIDVVTEAPTVEADDVSGQLVIYSGRSEPLSSRSSTRSRPSIRTWKSCSRQAATANWRTPDRRTGQPPGGCVHHDRAVHRPVAGTAGNVFQSYLPAGADQLPAEFIGADNLWTGLTRRARVIMYNRPGFPGGITHLHF
jgi:hypothetical protein